MFSEKTKPVYEIPFPTVTVCTDIKIRRTNFDYTDVWQKLNDENAYKKFPNVSDVEKLYVLQPLCDDLPTYLDDYIKLNGLSARLADADERFWPLAKRYAPTLKDIMSNCSWRRDPYNCSDLFHEVLTDEGICFSFNLQNASELYKEETLHKHFHVTRHNKPSYYWNGHIPPNMTEQMIYPRRVYVGNEGLRFELILKRNDKNYACSGPVQSFKIQISSSNDHPHMHRNFYRIPMSHDVVMSVHPNIMNSTDELIKRHESDERQCIDAKEDDRQLNAFKIYTQRNCQLSALLYRQNEKCHCVAYWLPRNQYQRICRSAENFKCIESIESDEVLRIWNGSHVSFDCLPSCRSISYDAEISMAEYELNDYELWTKNKQSPRDSILKSRVLITFKDDQFLASHRAQMHTITDFIAECGGILGLFIHLYLFHLSVKQYSFKRLFTGLFMGFSILSIVEMVYFSTLRIGCSLRKRRQIKKRRLEQLKIIDELNGGRNVHEGSPQHSEYDNVPKMTY